MASEIKPIYGTDRVQLASVLPLAAPYSAFVFPTTFCNFKCAYCGHSLGFAEMKKQYDFTPEHMTMETYVKTIDQLAEFPQKLKMLSLTGQGEPLLNPHIADMVRIAKEKNVAERIEIISNASLLRPALADALIDAGLDTLRVSLQGLSSKKYEDICRAKVDFDEFVENIRYFYAHKKQTNLFLKVMDVALDEGEEEQFYRLFGDCTDRMYIEHMLPAYAGVEMTKDMVIETDRNGVKTARLRSICLGCFQTAMLNRAIPSINPLCSATSIMGVFWICGMVKRCMSFGGCSWKAAAVRIYAVQTAVPQMT